MNVNENDHDELVGDVDKLSIGASSDELDTMSFIGEPGTEEDQMEVAGSLIGGSAVHTLKSRRLSEPSPVVDDPRTHHDEDLNDVKAYKNQNKIFTFSLPFGGNPLSHLPSLRQLRSGIPIIGELSGSDDDDFNVGLSRHEIKERLKRQESINTLQEAYLFKKMKGQGSSRLRAVKRALTPSMSFASLLEDGKKKETIWDTIDGDIVILGGYRGSILRDTKTSRRLWIPIRAGFNIRKIDLLLGPKDEDEYHSEDTIYPDGMMTHLGPVDIARGLERKLDNGKTRVRNFGYDWRLSSDINSDKLHKYLLELKKTRKDGKGVIVIAHSMGGLIAHHVMQKDPSLFRGLIYVGVPSECPNILGPIRFGDSVLFSQKILTPEVNFFMRSSFSFLPKDGRCFIDRKTHEKYNLDYFDPDVWTQHELSPLVSKSRLASERNGVEMKRSFSKQHHDPEFITSFEDSKDYLARTLKRTKKFLEELEYDETKEYPPLVIVYGNEVPTVRGCRVNGIEGIAKGEYDDFYYGPGDGVVNHRWLMPERRGFPIKAKIPSAFGHISLMTDFPAMGAALENILVAEKLEKEDTISYGYDSL